MIYLASALLAGLAAGGITEPITPPEPPSICDLQKIVDDSPPGRTGVQVIAGNMHGKRVELTSCGTDVHTLVQPIWSASKVVAGVLIMAIHDDQDVDFTINDKVSKHLEYWSQEQEDPKDNDPRSQITIKNLFVQDSGIAGCTCCMNVQYTWDQCSQQIHDLNWVADLYENKLFMYDEGNFVVGVAAAIKATGAATMGELWEKYIANKVGIDTSRCRWIHPMADFVDPGAGLSCTAFEYAKFMEGLMMGKLISEEMMNVMENRNIGIEGIHAVLPPGSRFDPAAASHYAFGTWIKEKCGHPEYKEDCGPYQHSIGYEGVLPVWKWGKDRFWAIIFRSGGMLGGEDGDVYCETCDRWKSMCLQPDACDARTNTFNLDKYPVCTVSFLCRDCYWDDEERPRCGATDPATRGEPPMEDFTDYGSYGGTASWMMVNHDNILQKLEAYLAVTEEPEKCKDPERCPMKTDCGHKNVELEFAGKREKKSMKKIGSSCACENTCLGDGYMHWTWQRKSKKKATCTCFKSNKPPVGVLVNNENMVSSMEAK